ncbi:hypothetical protein PIB30_024676 [Stylosanthes scabra]|uniref:Uncharacterized protein n=1 Tax=Stylosanthes scabra TaxID=79078 RepID=A0ABU6Z7C1_9FABA|nr:hypothetical protein [Stylosanthes scabra]
MPLATDIHPLPTLENCMVLCAKGETDITSRSLLEVVLGRVQQGPRLAHFCPSSEVCCRDPIPRASLQLHCLTRDPACPEYVIYIILGEVHSTSNFRHWLCFILLHISVLFLHRVIAYLDDHLFFRHCTASLQDRLHGVLVSLLEELSPAILKFCRFFGGRVDVTVSFTGTSGVGVGICTTVLDRNAASLGEVRVGG